jgi:nucleoside-diphosphate-sugar epimerase
LRALVTGGGGFLGGVIVRRLLERGDEVHCFSRSEHPGLRELGATQHRGDLGDPESLTGVLAGALNGVDVVFHVAAKAGVWGNARSYERANVQGTENVVKACRRAGVSRLVFTSSPSVVFAGKHQEGVDESIPYPAGYLTHYPRTKALAEQLVLAANDEQLATTSLRPHLIWGPGDNHLVPRIIRRAQAGRLRLVDSGRHLVDTVYVDNAADAHLLAADRLAPGAPPAGRAYFISQGEPLPMGEVMNRILHAAGLEPVSRSISGRMAYAVGATLEAVHGLLGMQAEPVMTRFVARQLATAHWFDISAARRDFGYEPAIDIDEGFRRLAASLRAQDAA